MRVSVGEGRRGVDGWGRQERQMSVMISRETQTKINSESENRKNVRKGKGRTVYLIQHSPVQMENQHHPPGKSFGTGGGGGRCKRINSSAW